MRYGMPQVRLELSQRFQNESAFCQPRMRYPELRKVYNLIAKEQNVDVHRPGPVPYHSSPPERSFDLSDAKQQPHWPQPRSCFGNQIQEIRLLGYVQRRGLVYTRYSLNPTRLRVQFSECRSQCLLTVAHIGTER